MLHPEVGGEAEMGERLRHPAAGAVARRIICRAPAGRPGATAHANHWTDLFEISRRRTWPFHIHNPVRTITGRKTYRVGGGIVWKFFKRTINITEYRNAKD